MITPEKTKKIQAPYMVMASGKPSSQNEQRAQRGPDPFTFWLKKRYGIDYQQFRMLSSNVRADYLRQFDAERKKSKK